MSDDQVVEPAVPTLDPATVADDETLAAIVDSFIGRDAQAQRWLALVVEEQERLRASIALHTHCGRPEQIRL